MVVKFNKVHLDENLIAQTVERFLDLQDATNYVTNNMSNVTVSMENLDVFARKQSFTEYVNSVGLNVSSYAQTEIPTVDLKKSSYSLQKVAIATSLDIARHKSEFETNRILNQVAGGIISEVETQKQQFLLTGADTAFFGSQNLGYTYDNDAIEYETANEVVTEITKAVVRHYQLNLGATVNVLLGSDIVALLVGSSFGSSGINFFEKLMADVDSQVPTSVRWGINQFALENGKEYGFKGDVAKTLFNSNEVIINTPDTATIHADNSVLFNELKDDGAHNRYIWDFYLQAVELTRPKALTKKTFTLKV